MHPAIAHTVELSLVYISWLINCTISFFFFFCFLHIHKIKLKRNQSI
ncbi:unnamed protein product [Musa acuminata subsp. malaccensis]|uniref:(wild Malaysian banana) hypothetical protein n=1 Tax=Musa acuminata subsp. malaccensis TaxID=214687 RepID=A0A804L2J8_MUSAM|nr:unnamed protein product [Musa acuminata subsp. malaccensis]